MNTSNTSSVPSEAENQKINDTLNSIFSDSCLKHEVPQPLVKNIIKNGASLFTIDSRGEVQSLSSYTNIAEYVIAHRDEPFPGDDLGSVDNLTKGQLYNRLVKSANAGDMAEYRRLREKYSAL